MRKLSALTLSVFAISALPTELNEAYAAPHKKHFKKRMAKAPIKKAYKKNPVLCGTSKTDKRSGGAFESVPVQVKPMETTSGKDHGSYGNMNHTGLYIGLGASGKRLSGDYNLTSPIGGINKSGISTVGIGADIHFGYMHQIDSWGIGAETYFDPLTIETKEELRFNNQAQEYKLRMSNTYGLTFKIGYHVSASTLIFGRVGLERTKMQVKFTDASGVMAPINSSKNKIGMTFGLGLREVFSDRWAFGAEYFYSLYDRQTFAAGTTNSRVRPGGHTVRFTISYLI